MSARQAHAAASRQRPRCGACQADLSDAATWQCPACQADLHEAGIVVRRPLRDRLRESVAVLAYKLRRRRVREAVCGRCRYRVHGLTELTCPECGSDLLTVGADRPRFSGLPIVMFTLMLLAWTGLVFGTLVYLLSWVYYSHTVHYAPKDYEAGVTGSIALAEAVDKNGQRIERRLMTMKIDGQVEGVFLPHFHTPPVVPLEVTVEPGGSRFRLDAETDTFTLHEPPVDAEERLIAEGPVSKIDAELVGGVLDRTNPDLPKTQRPVDWVASRLRRLPEFVRERQPTDFTGRTTGGGITTGSTWGEGDSQYLGDIRLFGNSDFEYRVRSVTVGWFYPVVQWSGVAVWLVGVVLMLWWAGRGKRNGKRRTVGTVRT